MSFEPRAFDKKLYEPDNIKYERQMILNSLGVRISIARKKMNDSQQLLAMALGVSDSTISRYENGECEIPASIIPIISARYKVAPSRLFDFEIFKGALSGHEWIDFLSTSVAMAKEKDKNKAYSDAALIANFFAGFIEKNIDSAFDMLCLWYFLLDGLNKISIVEENNGNDINISNLKTTFDDFVDKVNLMKTNDYKRNISVLYEELVSDLYNNKTVSSQKTNIRYVDSYTRTGPLV